MRILLTHRPGGAYAFVSDGWLNAAKAAGHTVARWDGNIDAWHKFDPDLYVGCSGHRQPIPWKRRAKIAIHVNPYGPVLIKNINESSDAIRWVIDQKPDVVFGYGYIDDNKLWEHWTSRHRIPWIPMPTAGDATIYKARPDVERTVDIGYVGGRWNYKAINIDKYLLPLFKSNDVRCAVHGWGGWPPGISQGQITDTEVPEFLNRCKICPCVAEPHTTTWGIDLPERIFKASLSGALVIHDPVAGLQRYMSSVLMANNPAEYIELCKLWSKPHMNIKRLEVAKHQRQEVLAKHTYFHRMACLLNSLKFSAEADNMLRLAESIRNGA
jgi:hypothetical protein